MNAKLAIETIKTLNGQDDMGVEDFVKTIKKAKFRCSEPEILLDLILAKKIIGNAEKAIRYIPINSYEDLFIALRQNLKQTNSLVSLKSKLESCKQGMTETVQNFTLRFRQITNEIYYLVQSQHVNPTKRRLKIELEEEEAVNRYMLNLRREIGMQVRLLKSATISEAQSHAIETETWLKDSQQARQAIPKPPVRPWPRPVGPSRSNANTTPFAKNTQQPVKGPMNCHKCGKIGQFASQCFKQGFPQGTNLRRTPQPVRAVQEEEDTDGIEMIQEEILEQMNFEESAEYQLYADDYEQSEQDEEQENIDY